MSLLQHIGKISSGLKYGLYFIVSRSQNQIRVSCHTFEAVDLTQTVNVYTLPVGMNSYKHVVVQFYGGQKLPPKYPCYICFSPLNTHTRN